MLPSVRMGGSTYFIFGAEVLPRRMRSLFRPRLMLAYDFFVETEKSEGAGSGGMGIAPFVAVFEASACTKNFS
jgi:hypothetical protein